MRAAYVPVIAIAGAAVLFAIYERDEIRDLLGSHGDPPQLVFDFERPVDRATLDRAARLLETRVLGYRAGVHIDGNRILVDAEIADSLKVQLAVDPQQHVVHGLSLRIVDYVPDYLAQLKPHLRETSAKALEITAGIDAIGEHLVIPSGGRYVNPAWAERHHCDTRDRIVGTGVSCLVTARQRLDALLHGDPELFVTPLDPALAVPTDRELVIDDVGPAAHVYVVERAPIELAPGMFASVTADGQNVTVVLTDAGAAALAPRASGRNVELAIVAGMRLVPVQIVRAAATSLVFPLEAERAGDLVYAFSIHAMHALMHID